MGATTTCEEHLAPGPLCPQNTTLGPQNTMPPVPLVRHQSCRWLHVLVATELGSTTLQVQGVYGHPSQPAANTEFMAQVLEYTGQPYV